MFQLEYIHYLIVLLIISGFYILAIDTKTYRNMKREKRATIFLGWLNVSLGILLFATNWVYVNLVW